jgi:DNA-binding NtrC family response regulator
MDKKHVIIAGWDENYIKALCSVLEREHYSPLLVCSLGDAGPQLQKRPFRVMLIDLDLIAIDNHSLKELRRRYPEIGLVGLSSRRFHQELEEAMSRYIDACFEKSADYDDLLYWLKAVFDPSVVQEGRGQS